MAHKTIALTTELRELGKNSRVRELAPKKIGRAFRVLVMHLYCEFAKDLARPAIAQVVKHLTVDHCSNQMVPGSIPGGRTFAQDQEEENEMEVLFVHAKSTKRCACRESNPGHKHGRLV